jgi:hypothetical protein
VQPTEAQIVRLRRICRERLGNRTLQAPPAYLDSLALCVIDAVQSSGVGGATVGRVIERYRAHRLAQGGDPETDGAVALLGSFHDLRSSRTWAREIGTAERISSDPAAPLKAEVIEAAANALSDIELYSAADLREVVTYPDLIATVHAAWTTATADRAPATWRRLLTVAGVPGVRPDRHTVRFVAIALSVPPRSLTPEFAADAVERVAATLSAPPAALDQAMSRWQRAR